MPEVNSFPYYCFCPTPGYDTITIPLTYTANHDGSYTLVCNGTFTCDEKDPFDQLTQTCTGAGATVTRITHAGTGNLGASWRIAPLSKNTTFTVTISLMHYNPAYSGSSYHRPREDYGKLTASNTITLPASKTDALNIPLTYTANHDGSYNIICNASFTCPLNEAFTLNSRTCSAAGVTVTPISHLGSGNLGASWRIPKLTEQKTFTVNISGTHRGGTVTGSKTITLPVSNVDNLEMPLSYIANVDGSYTLICNANLACPFNEPFSINSFTCSAEGVTITQTEHIGTGNLGRTWTVTPPAVDTTVSVNLSVNHYGGVVTKNNSITLPASIITYYTSTVTHTIAIANVTNADTIQWQESLDGTNWADIEGANANTLIIGTWEGAEAMTEIVANNAAYSAVPAYDKFYRCKAMNRVWTTISNVLHVTHTDGAETPAVTTTND